MRHLIATIAAIVPALALATGGGHTEKPSKPEPWPVSSTSSASATSGALGGAGGAAAAYAWGSPGSGGNDLYVLPAPIGGANLPAGMCQRSRYHHVAVGWNLVSVADGDSHTDMECLQLLVRLEDLRRQPVPAPAVQLLTRPAVCAPPAKARSVKAAKAAGKCK